MEKGRAEITGQPEQGGKTPQPEAKKPGTVEHFTADPDNAYGEVWAEVVQEYLRTNYKNGSESQEACKVIVSGITYQALERKQRNMTVFYDADGNTLFEVENKRLEKEYAGMMNPAEEAEKGAEPQMKKQPEDAGETALESSGRMDETSVDCEKSADSEETEAAPETKDISGKKPEENAGEAGKKKRKVYTSGAEKIRDEAEEEYKEAKNEEEEALTKALMEQIIKYVTEKCETDPDYNALVIQEHKTWERCYQFMSEKAQKMAPTRRRGMLVEGSTIFAWMDEYYQADDLAEVEAEIEAEKKRAESIKRVEKLEKELKAKNAAKGKKAAPEAKKKQTPKAKKNSKDIEGQMDMFSMMDTM